MEDDVAEDNEHPKPEHTSEPTWLLGAACALPLAVSLYLSLDNLIVAVMVGFMFTMAFALAFERKRN